MNKERVLIVDDEKNIVSSLQGILSDEGYHVNSTEDGLKALDMIHADPPDLVLLDIWIPGMDGIEVLKTIKTDHPETEVLIMSGHGTIDTAVKATKLGAFDFIEKPFSLDQLVQSVESVFKLKKARWLDSNRQFLNQDDLPFCFELMTEVKKNIKTAARNNKPILLLGEKGTGKEIIAQAIHRQSKKSHLPFVKLNCSIRPMHNIQAQLFAKGSNGSGAFTAGAKAGQQKAIYLSNVEALNKGLQEKLAKTLRKESDKKTGPLHDFLAARIFASSTKDLNDLVRKGQFHKDLYIILKGATIEIPPLREHVNDIPAIVEHYFQEHSRNREDVREIEPEAMDALCKYPWTENLKELRSVLEQIQVTGSSQGRIALNDLPPAIRRPQGRFDVNDFDRFDSFEEAELTWEKEFIIHHLKSNHWDIEKTCGKFKISKKKFQEKLQALKIELPTSKREKSESHQLYRRTLKRSVVLCGSGLHSGIKTGLILQPLPTGSGIIFGDISSGDTIPADLKNVQSTEYSTCLKKGFTSVATIEHIMAVLHMYRITDLLIKIGDEAPVMDGSAKDFCQLIEDGEFEEQDQTYEEIIINKTYHFGSEKNGGAKISIEPADKFTVQYYMEYPEPIGKMDYTFQFDGAESFKQSIAPARTFGFLKDVAQLTKMGFASGGKLDNFILLGDGKVLNTELRFEDEFVRHKILDIIGDFYLLGKPIRGLIRAHKSGHTQNIGLLKQIQESLSQ